METRYCWGKTDPVVASVASAAVVQVGDLVALDAGNVKSAADIAWDTDLAKTQQNFHAKFLGISDQRSRAGDTENLRVNTRAVYEMDCASATFELGDLVGPAKAAGNALEPQKVARVATVNLSVGRVVQQYKTATTRVRFEIASSVVTGGPQAIVP